MKKLNRRNFISSSSFLSLFAFGSFFPSAPKKRKKLKDRFVHHVYFWMNNPESEKEKAKLLEGLRTLEDIEVVQMSHIGVPAGTDRDVIETGYDYSLLLVFDNPEDQNTYQTHPIHLKFVDGYASLWDKVIVYDSVDV